MMPNNVTMFCRSDQTTTERFKKYVRRYFRRINIATKKYGIFFEEMNKDEIAHLSYRKMETR